MNQLERYNLILGRMNDLYDILSERVHERPMTAEVTVNAKRANEDPDNWITVGEYILNSLAQAATDINMQESICGIAMKTARKDHNGYNKHEIGFEHPL